MKNIIGGCIDMDERNTYKRNLYIIISIASVLAIAGVVVIILLLSNNSKKEKYYETTKRAETYISSMRYEDAIAEYEKALELNDEDPVVYENLAVLYEQTGNSEKAKQIAKTGYIKTKKAVLSEIVSNITAYGTSGYEISSNMRLVVRNIENLQAKAEGHVIKFNLMVSNQVVGNVYQDYVTSYGEGTYSTDNEHAIVDFDDVKLFYPLSLTSLDVIRAYTGSPEGVSYKNLSSIFEGIDTSEGVTYEDACEAFEETVDIEQDSTRGIYYLHTIYLGMDIMIESDSEGNIIKNEPWNLFVSLTPKEDTTESGQEEAAEEENSAVMGSVSGRIKDASSGSGVGDAKLTVRKGSDMKVGASVAEYETDSSGNYLLALEEGNYCIQVTKSGFIDAFENVTVMRNVDRTGVDIVISTTLNGEVRVVLEWESAPSDLDMYLTGSTDSGSSVNVNYRNMKNNDSSGNCIAELDVDDQNGNGPETITIHDSNGKYNISVEDFTGSGTMASTNVRVTVYLPDNTSQTITINHNLGSTNKWNVCTIDHGKVSVINN